VEVSFEVPDVFLLVERFHHDDARCAVVLLVGETNLKVKACIDVVKKKLRTKPKTITLTSAEGTLL
jgi:hypothetical protein